MNPAVLVLVAKEERAKGHKNTAMLLGLHLKPQEGSRAADRMFFFSLLLVGEVVPSQLSSVNGVAWTNCRDSVEWH